MDEGALVRVCGEQDLLCEAVSALLREEGYRVVEPVSTLSALVEDASAAFGDLYLVVAEDAASVDVGALADLAAAHPSAKVTLVLTTFTATDRLTMECAGVHGMLLATISRRAFVNSLDLILLGEHVFSAAPVTLRDGAALPPTEAAAALDACAASGAADAVGEPDSSQTERAVAVENAPKQTVCASAAPAVRHAEALPDEEPAPTRRRVDGLSDREWEILRCLVNGAPNKVIARRFDIAEATVKVHLKAILRKIGVANRTQAAVWALARLSPDEQEALQDGEEPTASRPAGWFAQEPVGLPS